MEALMNEANEKQATFLGTYFDRDAVMRLSRWADTLAWIILSIYAIYWIFSILQFIGQYASGVFFEKGITFLNMINIIAPYFLQPIPGIAYFFGLEAVSKALLILLDMEDNTRRAARK
jgi:hypothetical protein